MPVVTRRHLPTEIQTLEWTGDNAEEMTAFCGRIPGRITLAFQPPIVPDGTARCWNSEETAWLPVPLGHHLARGPRGELWPLSPAAATDDYEIHGDPT